MTPRLQQVLDSNPEFAEALERCEPWAVQRREQILGIDGQAMTQHPERLFDGKKRNWCGSCPDPEGCVTCDLKEDPTFLKEVARTQHELE